jgi:3-oxoacyl-[acyl-carrier protein] reductase
MYPTAESRAEFSQQIPLGHFGEPRDVADLVAFLCSARGRYITGQRILVDGGLSRAM